MADAPFLKRLYLRFRHPKVFLIALCTFIGSMLVLHFFLHIDSDWGGTNLTLSCEASIASAVVTVAAEETIRLLHIVIERIAALFDFVKARFAELHAVAIEVREQAKIQEKTLRGVLLIAEAQRDILADRADRLHALEGNVERILQTLTEDEDHDT